MRAVFLLLVLVVLAATGMFAYQNQIPMSLHFVNWRWEHVQMWYPVVAAAGGVLIACILYGLASGTGWRIRHMRLNRTSRDSQAQVRALEQENLELRRQLNGSETEDTPFQPSSSYR
jgi:uncharacterized integral membrane protein